MSRFLKKYWHLIALALIILIGAFFRFYRLGTLSEFTYDPARDAEVMRKIVQDHKLTLLGPPTSVSIGGANYGTTYFGPIFYYLLAPGLLFSHMDPVGLAALVAFWGIITVFLVYLLVLELTKSKKASLASSFLFAISPGAIEYSRFIWNPNLIPPLALLTVYFLVKYQKRPQGKLILIAGLLLGVSIQLHFIAYFFVFLPLIMLIFWQFFNKDRKPMFWKASFLCLVGFIFGVFPMILFDLRHGFLNTKSIIYNLTQAKNVHGDNFGFSFDHLIKVLEILPAKFLGLNNLTLSLIISVIVFLGAIILLIRKDFRKTFWLPSVYFLLGVLGTSIYDNMGKVWARYTIPLFPAVFILFGIFLYLFFQKKMMLRLSALFLFLALSFSCIKADMFLLNENTALKGMGFFREVSSLIIKNIRKEGVSGHEVNIANLVNLDRRATSFRYFLKAQKIPILGVEDYPNADILYVIDKEYGWDGIVNNTDTWEVYSFKPKKLEKIIPGPRDTKIYKISKGD